jgi:hypothetical protein
MAVILLWSVGTGPSGGVPVLLVRGGDVQPEPSGTPVVAEEVAGLSGTVVVGDAPGRTARRRRVVGVLVGAGEAAYVDGLDLVNLRAPHRVTWFGEHGGIGGKTR